MTLTEHQQCVMFANRLRREGYFFTKIAQETRTSSRSQKRKNKLEGLNRGFPDYVIVLKNGKVCCVEMKRKKGGAVSLHQKKRIEKLNKSGVNTKVCYGASEAKNFILEQEK